MVETSIRPIHLHIYTLNCFSKLTSNAGVKVSLERTCLWIENGFSVASPEGADIVVNIERLSFTDGNIALDIDGVGGSAYRIYKAAFARTPDVNGVSYWIAQMDRGMELVNVADRFIGSPEFKIQYGNDPSNEQFLCWFSVNFTFALRLLVG